MILTGKHEHIRHYSYVNHMHEEHNKLPMYCTMYCKSKASFLICLHSAEISPPTHTHK